MFDSDFGGLKDIDGIGETVIESLRDWENGNLPLICSGKDVEYLASFFEFEKSKTGDRLNGMTFVITGSLQHYENRDAMIAVIESLGGKVSGSVSSKTTALINNDVNSTSGKNKKAKELSIPIISEEDFVREYIG